LACCDGAAGVLNGSNFDELDDQAWDGAISMNAKYKHGRKRGGGFLDIVFTDCTGEKNDAAPIGSGGGVRIDIQI